MTSEPRRGAAAFLAALLVTVAASACGGTGEPPSSPATVAASEVGTPPVVAPAPVAPAGMPASPPVRVQVPAIGVDSELMELGLQADGTLEVPPAAFPAGWFTGAPTPGELGPAVIVGHIDWATGPGVFHRLGSLAVGDEIRVSRVDGSVAVFRVAEATRYPKDEFPTDRVYGDIDHAGLRLISCGGVFDRTTKHYEDNIVVFAELVT